MEESPQGQSRGPQGKSRGPTGRAQKKCDRNIDMRAINSKAGIWRRGNERNHLGLYLCEPSRGLTQEIKCQALPLEIFNWFSEGPEHKSF